MIKEAIKGGIKKRLYGDYALPLTTSDENVNLAINQQTEIGWNNLFLGLASNKWAII